jgi:hypothetical protein
MIFLKSIRKPKQKQKQILTGVRVLLTFTLLTPFFSDAYVPRSGYQIERIAQLRSNFEAVVIDSEVTLFEDGEATSVKFYERTVVDYRANRFQSVAMTQSGQRIYDVVEAMTPMASQQSAAMSLLLSPHPGSIELSLVSLGVPILTEADRLKIRSEEDRRKAERTQIERKKINLIGSEGDKSESEESPEDTMTSLFWTIGQDSQSVQAKLWVKKDQFLPAALQWIDPSTKALLYVSFEQYFSGGGLSFPSRILFQKDGQTLIEIRTKRPQTNPENLKFLSNPSNQLSEYGRALGEDYRKLIQIYYRYFR